MIIKETFSVKQIANQSFSAFIEPRHILMLVAYLSQTVQGTQYSYQQVQYKYVY
jgi:hypothetical protein